MFSRVIAGLATHFASQAGKSAQACSLNMRAVVYLEIQIPRSHPVRSLENTFGLAGTRVGVSFLGTSFKVSTARKSSCRGTSSRS